MKRLSLQTNARTDFREITAAVQDAAAGLGVRDGVVTVFVPHTTAGITINEHADPDVMRDVGHALDRLVPWRDPAYRHAEGNSAAHVKSILVGSSVRVPVVGGRLQLGTWQGIFFCEFDGPRTREVWVVAG
ncbi:MAG: secondary thiamine-phosphate synthase enzyme YjbQ [Kiritimatiellae bacterium]|nr:secondary thiamine-phosphate synthase enzyme YjbQ [Kiritimatiellia bacterium]MDW8457712.1 secondary thiamine-phosphate synthase enzyme YjbQ [Verrucomicrobiota bacterium]